MAIQFDNNGVVTFPDFVESGDFYISLNFTYAGSDDVLIGKSDGPHSFIATLSGSVRVRINYADSPNVGSLVVDQSYSLIVSRTGSTVTINLDGAETTYTASGIIELGLLGAYNTNVLKYSGIISGNIIINGTSGNRTYDTNQAQASTTLPDTTSSQDGTLSGFTTGGFLGVQKSIELTSVSDYSVKKRDANGNAVFTIAGLVTGNPASIEYKLDDGNWAVLDASPVSTFSGDITVTGQQDLTVRHSDDIAITATAQKLTAAICIAAWGQSNCDGRGVNNQSVTVSGSNPIPIMFKQGSFLELADPTGIRGASEGSVWPLVAQKFSDAGIPVCIANVGVGSTSVSQWQSNSNNFGDVIDFATAVGGLSMAITVIGEQDSTGTPKAQFKTEYLEPASYLDTNYGADTYCSYFPVGNNTGSSTEQVVYS